MLELGRWRCRPRRSSTGPPGRTRRSLEPERSIERRPRIRAAGARPPTEIAIASTPSAISGAWPPSPEGIASRASWVNADGSFERSCGLRLDRELGGALELHRRAGLGGRARDHERRPSARPRPAGRSRSRPRPCRARGGSRAARPRRWHPRRRRWSRRGRSSSRARRRRARWRARSGSPVAAALEAAPGPRAESRAARTTIGPLGVAGQGQERRCEASTSSPSKLALEASAR